MMLTNFIKIRFKNMNNTQLIIMGQKCKNINQSQINLDPKMLKNKTDMLDNLLIS